MMKMTGKQYKYEIKLTYLYLLTNSLYCW